MSGRKERSKEAATAVASATAEVTTTIDPTKGEDYHTRKLFGIVEVPSFLPTIAFGVLRLALLVYAIWNAFRIRTYALTEFGFVIHEFDPWFNFRATQYLSKHGWHAFFHWFDHMSWYPLGRPVGTTIYPGLQLTAVAIHRVLRWLGGEWKMTLNDVCCYVPCWGGAAATFFLAALTYEVSGSATSAVFGAVIMAIVPAHMMRSVGGGFDNESIAMTAIIATFYFWVRSLRTSGSWPFGILAGLSYGYMVAAWGGFVFVLNMVALHAAVTMVIDMCRNKYSVRLYRSYSLFFIIGTYLATCVPPVGMQPFKSLEQLFAFFVFCIMQIVHVSEIQRKKADVAVLSVEGVKIRIRAVGIVLAAIAGVCVILAPTGFFGPISSRVRGLFLRHTRTGNPLVDSVAEHQPATADAYWHYLHYACYGWTIGTFLLIPVATANKRFRAPIFMILYSVVAYFFSLKMARLIILTAPVGSCMAGVTLSALLDWILNQFSWSAADSDLEQLIAEGKDEKTGKSLARKKSSSDESVANTFRRIRNYYRSARQVRMSVAVVIIALALTRGWWAQFESHSEQMAHSFANPQLMFKTRLNNGQTVMIDDYREAYFWLRDKTPEDSRVMAWWDYGYQITGIGNRTSIADGNTWNHEHIATLGKCLTSKVPEAHSLIRHLADYVLVWAGGGGDDLAKSPHMARIGNSVYRDICPKDPLCQRFTFQAANYENPTPMMRDSLLYNLHQHNKRKGVRVDPALFQEAYSTKYGLVRIFKVMNVSEESKAWLADPKNRECDAPGSWYCTGKYPPAPEINALMAKRRSFSQLEDFNVKRTAEDEDYVRQYMNSFGH